jgi:hypothetical protein
VAGEWSLKDVLAHISWHEREMIDVLEQRTLAGSDLWSLPLHERNAAIYEKNRALPLAEVLSHARESYPRLLSLIEGIEEEELHDAARFENMPGEWQPWQVISSNTYEHYDDHLPDLEAWLERKR